jgi:hypothetical protein
MFELKPVLEEVSLMTGTDLVHGFSGNVWIDYCSGYFVEFDGLLKAIFNWRWVYFV